MNCYNMDYPLRNNSTSNIYFCEIWTCMNRDTDEIITYSDHTEPLKDTVANSSKYY